MIKWLIWTIWTPMSSVLKKADKLNLSLSLSPDGMNQMKQKHRTWVTSQGTWGFVGHLNSSLSGQDGHHFADDIFKGIFSNENVRISIQISLKFVPNGPIDNKSATVLSNGLAPNRWQVITRTEDDPVYWCIYAALGGDELTMCQLQCF